MALNKLNRCSLLLASTFLLAMLIYGLSDALDSSNLPLKPLSYEQTHALDLRPDTRSVFVNKTKSIDSLSVDNWLEHPQVQEILIAEVNQQKVLLQQFLASVGDDKILGIAITFANSTLEKIKYDALNLHIILHWVQFSANNALAFSIRNHPPETIKQVIKAIISNKCSELEALNYCVSALPRHESIDVVLEEMAMSAVSDKNYSQALLLLNALQNHENSQKRTINVAEQWISDDVEAALQWAIKRQEFYVVAEQAIYQMMQEDPYQAFQYISYLPHDSRNHQSALYQDMIYRLVTNANIQMIKLGLEFVESIGEHDFSIDIIGQTWYEKQPEAVIEWALNGDERRMKIALEAFDYIVQEREGGYMQALDLLLSTPTYRYELREQMLNIMLTNRADNNDYERLIAVLEKIPPSDDPKKYYKRYIDEWLVKDNDSAIEAITHLAPGELQTKWVMSTVQEWAVSDPLKAIALADKQQTHTLKDHAIAVAIQTWAINDSQGLLTWLQTQSADKPNLDQGLFKASERLIADQSYQGIVIDLINRIHSNQLRNSLWGMLSAQTENE